MHKNVVILHNDILIEETYGDYVSRYQHTNPDGHVIQYKYGSNKWANLNYNHIILPCLTK